MMNEDQTKMMNILIDEKRLFVVNGEGGLIKAAILDAINTLQLIGLTENFIIITDDSNLDSWIDEAKSYDFKLSVYDENQTTKNCDIVLLTHDKILDFFNNANEDKFNIVIDNSFKLGDVACDETQIINYHMTKIEYMIMINYGLLVPTKCLWAQFKVLDCGKRLGDTYQRFRKKYIESNCDIYNDVFDITFLNRESTNHELTCLPFIEKALTDDDVHKPITNIFDTKKFSPISISKGLQKVRKNTSKHNNIKASDIAMLQKLINLQNTYRNETFIVFYSLRFDADLILKNTDAFQISMQNLHGWNDGKISMLVAYAPAISRLDLIKCPNNIVWYRPQIDKDRYRRVNKILCENKGEKRVKIITVHEKETTEFRVPSAEIYDILNKTTHKTHCRTAY